MKNTCHPEKEKGSSGLELRLSCDPITHTLQVGFFMHYNTQMHVSGVLGRVLVKFLNSSAQIGNNRDQNNYLLKTCYTASCEVAGTQIEIAE